MAPLLDGAAADATPLERALVALVHRAHEAPATLAPRELDPLRAAAGDAALDYVLVLCAFHFITRIADLLAVPPEALPLALRRFEPLRRLGVRVASVLLRRMDLTNRPYPASFEDNRRRFETVRGWPVGDALDPLRPRPPLVEALALVLEERMQVTSLDRDTLARVDRTVEAALPRALDDVTGFHARPADAVEAFAFVGTRYAYRTSDELIGGLRRAGFDDLGILDLAIAVADANQWARMYRLLGLPAGLIAPAA